MATKKMYGWFYEDETEIEASALAKFSTLAEVEKDILDTAIFQPGYGTERAVVFQFVKAYDIVFPDPKPTLKEVK